MRTVNEDGGGSLLEPGMIDIAGFLKPAFKILEGVIPNANERKRAEEAMQTGVLNAVNAANQAQADINKIEAGSIHWLAATWRPAVGWTCAIALFYHFVAYPFLRLGFDLPALEVDGLMNLVTAMLGFGGLRTIEKIKGVNKKS